MHMQIGLIYIYIRVVSVKEQNHLSKILMAKCELRIGAKKGQETEKTQNGSLSTK